VVDNPCRTAEKAVAADTDQDIRFLVQAELDALIAAAVNPHGRRRAGTAHRDKTTLIYADYAPSANEVEIVNDVFGGAL
jgi:hypothetical protein